MNNINNNSKKYQPIVFVNNPITSTEEDVIGFDAQVDTLQCAINNGANMIGVIADYGSGKSSMAEMLSLSVQEEGNPPPIRINMWDCLSNTNKKDKISENVSTLTKSFLYQLSNGYNDKLGKYVNKLLSKNYGSIALALNDSKRFWMWFIVAGICYTINQIASISGTGIMKHLPACYDVIASGVKLSAPIFLFIAIISIILGMKDAYIAFSHWNMAHRREPEINDVFDTYNIIIEKIKPEDEKKQLIFIDDLDRINKKKLIVEFLKELYRFQDSLSEHKNKFVFIISIKPESELKKDGDNSNIEDSEVYSKIFDLTLSLKPIHFDDYDSILFKLLENNTEQKESLEKLIGQDINDVLPESFRWIKRGTNLTLRDLKDRLNQAISIMISLKNKDYQVETAVTFEPCAAVSYLENKYPEDYYSLIKSETEFARFIQVSREIVDKKDGSKDIAKLKQTFNNEFKIQEYKRKFTDSFVNELCEMVVSGLFNDDFRMYFYTYPKGSHIKTTDERTLCNYILFPNSFDNYENVDDAVNRAFKSRENQIIKQTISSLETFSPVLLENDTLFLLAIDISMEKTFDTFTKKVLESDIDEKYKVNYWKRTLVLSKNRYDKFVSMIISKLLNSQCEPNYIISNRRAIIKGVKNKIIGYKELYINQSYKVPQITKEEIELINNVDISLQLVDIDKLQQEHYEYLMPVINAKPLLFSETFEYALKIWLKSSRFFNYAHIGEKILEFLSINKVINNTLFDIVCNSSIQNEKIAAYLNQTLNEPFSTDYLKMIDDLGFEGHLSEDIVYELLENKFYYTPLLYCINNNCLSLIDNYLSNITEFLETCERINSVNEDAIVTIRKYLYNDKNIEESKVLYYAPYPIITKDEYIYTNKFELTDASQIDEDNCMDMIEIIHSKKYSSEGLIFLVKWLFDKATNKECITDSSLRKKFVGNLDFNLLGMKNLHEEQRDEVYIILEDDFDIVNGKQAIELLKRIGSLIPKVEDMIQEETSLKEEYCTLISNLDEMTAKTIDWCKKNYITCGFSPRICDLLYKNGDYQNYIIAETLRQKYMIINENISFDYYIDVYTNVDEMYDIMSEHRDFLEKLQDEADFSELSYEQIEAIFYGKQTERFFNYIFSDKIDNEIKIKYLKIFGSFREEKDSIAFQKLICQEDNLELLGSWDLYHRIYNLLWETHPGHKRMFTRAWNRRWKEELNK
jgi:hypothetical protein